jgi:peptidyl-dipeptidase Dcp
VTDADGSLLGWLYTDFFPRAGRKSPGAWMTDFREARGSEVRPLVNIVMNFTKPTPQKPSLLTAGEVSTFLHEFGHALHSLLTRAHYQSLAGTNVYRDFVELPSQFNENFLYEREFLDSFARHYQSGEPLPQELVDSLIASSQFGAAYACMRQLNFGFLDMAWHTITAPVTDPVEFERLAVKPVEIFAPVDNCLISPQFSHIFAGGYAAGYYSYKWAEVLDADAFAEFKRCGVFNPEVAARFRHNILETGGTCHPAELYRRFRGSDPDIAALLLRDGIHSI